MIATLTSQNQITIPVEVRKKAGLKPGERVMFVDDPKVGLTVRKVESYEELRGSLAKYVVGKPRLTRTKLNKIREEMWTERYRRYLKTNGKSDS